MQLTTFLVLSLIMTQCFVAMATSDYTKSDALWRLTPDLYCRRDVPGVGVIFWTYFGDSMLKIRLQSYTRGWSAVGFNAAESRNMVNAHLVIGYKVTEDSMERSCVTSWRGHNATNGYPSYDIQGGGIWSGDVVSTMTGLRPVTNFSFTVRLSSLVDLWTPDMKSSSLLLAYGDLAPQVCPADNNGLTKHSVRIGLDHRWDFSNGTCCTTFGCPEVQKSSQAKDSADTKCTWEPFTGGTDPKCTNSEAIKNLFRKLVTCRELRCTCIGGVTIAADTCSLQPTCVNLNCQRKKYLCDKEAFLELVVEEPACREDVSARASLSCEQAACEVPGCSEEDYHDSCTDYDSVSGAGSWRDLFRTWILVAIAVVILS